MKNVFLEINSLSLKYNQKDLEVIKMISLTVQKGEVVAILGPSGCGKTTLLNIISGYMLPKEAQVSGLIKLDKKTKTSVVPQEPRLLPWRNVLENVAFSLEAQGLGTKEAQEKAMRALDSVFLLDYANYYPENISVGMQQRVNFARAVVCNPNLLLLDEPFAALDYKTKKKLEECFLRIIRANHITAIFVTHNVSEAFSLADVIVVLSKKPTIVKKVILKKDFKKIAGKINGLYE